MRLLLPIALSISALPAKAAENPLKVELISEARSVAAGQTFFVGLHLEHPAGTHTYWKHPGIVGLATMIEWELPPGFKAGEIQWPAPQVVDMAGHQAQGYEGETLLTIPVTAAENLTASSVTLMAKASWMCCGKTCQPAVAVPFSITLPVAASAEIDPAVHPLFDTFRTKMPRPDAAWKSSVSRDEKIIRLVLAPPSAISSAEGFHFFTSDGQVDTNRKQEVEISSRGEIVLTLAASETGPALARILPGVLEIPGGYLEIGPAY